MYLFLDARAQNETGSKERSASGRAGGWPEWNPGAAKIPAMAGINSGQAGGRPEWNPRATTNPGHGRN